MCEMEAGGEKKNSYVSTTGLFSMLLVLYAQPNVFIVSSKPNQTNGWSPYTKTMQFNKKNSLISYRLTIVALSDQNNALKFKRIFLIDKKIVHVKTLPDSLLAIFFDPWFTRIVIENLL